MNRFSKVANIEGNRVHISALWLLCIWKSLTLINTIKVWYHISLYKEQCKLAIHFAEHNFGPFGHIFFVIVLFEPESKTLLRVNIIIFKLGSSDFHLLFRYLQNIYIFRAARETYIKRKRCSLWLAICFKIQQKYSFNFNKFIQLQQIYSFNFNKFIHIQQKYSFNFNKLFIFNKNIHSTSTNLFIFNKKYSFNFNKFIHIQQKYSFNFNKNIHSTSTIFFIEKIPWCYSVIRSLFPLRWKFRTIQRW
jgi:hypothetical protein